MELTYRQLFQKDLEYLIAQGGEVSAIITLVEVHQKRDSIARQLSFQEWIEKRVFECERCWDHFVPDSAEVEEEDVVLCKRCSGGSA